MLSSRHRARGVSLAIAATLAAGALAGPAMAAEAPGDGGGDQPQSITLRKAGGVQADYLTMRKSGGDGPVASIIAI